MTSWIVLMASAAVGIDYGWQPIAGGGFEYIIQIEPETLESLKNGADIFSQLPPALRGIRGYRVTVGKGPLPHQGEPPPEPLAQAAASDPNLGNPRGMPTAGGETAKRSEAGNKTAPAAMPPEPGSPPHSAQKTGYQQASDGAASPGAAPKAALEPAPEEGGSPSDQLPHGFDAAGDAATPPPWMSLNVALLALFASLGANLFLAWITVAQRGRYRSVLGRLALK